MTLPSCERSFMSRTWTWPLNHEGSALGSLTNAVALSRADKVSGRCSLRGLRGGVSGCRLIPHPACRVTVGLTTLLFSKLLPAGLEAAAFLPRSRHWCSFAVGPMAAVRAGRGLGQRWLPETALFPRCHQGVPAQSQRHQGLVFSLVLPGVVLVVPR